jgi:hypothetical protein
MTSSIDTSSIDGNFPVQGSDNPSQGFRDNFSLIKIALDTAAEEITSLQSSPVGVTTASSTVTGIIKVGTGLAIDGNASIRTTNILPSYTISSLSTFSPATAGAMVFVTNAPGGAQPCFYDGTNWFTVNGRTQI